MLTKLNRDSDRSHFPASSSVLLPHFWCPTRPNHSLGDRRAQACKKSNTETRVAPNAPLSGLRNFKLTNVNKITMMLTIAYSERSAVAVPGRRLPGRENR